MVRELRDAGHHEPGEEADSLSAALEEVVVQLFEEGMSSDDLLRMSDMVEAGKAYSPSVRAASHAAITREINDIEDVIFNYTSESELNDHASVLQRLAPLAGVSDYSLRGALEAIGDRIEEVQVSRAKASDPDVPGSFDADDDAFGDEALQNLFDSLR